MSIIPLEKREEGVDPASGWVVSSILSLLFVVVLKELRWCYEPLLKGGNDVINFYIFPLFF